MPYVQFQIRRDTAANWTTANPVLASGEMGLETDTGKFKFGNGTATWTELPYVATGGGGGGAVTESLIPTQDNQFDLGSPTAAFRSLYVGGNTIHIGNAEISATTEGNILFTNTLTNETNPTPAQVSGTLAGNISMIGGGTVMWSSDNISWTEEVTLVTNRANLVTKVGNVSITPSTVRLTSLDSLYYAIPLGPSDQTPEGLHIINAYETDPSIIRDNWFLLANTSIDNTILKWHPAAICLPPEGTYESNTATLTRTRDVRYIPVARITELVLTAGDVDSHIGMWATVPDPTLTLTPDSTFPVNGRVYIRNASRGGPPPTVQLIGLWALDGFDLDGVTPLFMPIDLSLAATTVFTLLQWDGTHFRVV
jgi:hypothetical protein